MKFLIALIFCFCVFLLITSALLSTNFVFQKADVIPLVNKVADKGSGDPTPLPPVPPPQPPPKISVC